MSDSRVTITAVCKRVSTNVLQESVCQGVLFGQGCAESACVCIIVEALMGTIVLLMPVKYHGAAGRP